MRISVRDRIPAARGHFERLEHTGAALEVSGWMFAPSREVESFQLLVDGARVEEIAPRERPDVAAAHPRHATARQCGFFFRLPGSPDRHHEWCEVEVRALEKGGSLLGRVWSPFKLDFEPRNCPPAEMMQRTSNVSDRESFWRLGLQCYGSYKRAIDRFSRVSRPLRLLDWGCGCGRILAMFLRHSPTVELHGCDIDGRGVEWCAEHLRPARFSVSGTLPPLPYPDLSFDVVLANSVFTHLDRHEQLRWLAELRRIMAPGGLLLATTQGPFVADLLALDDVAAELAAAGISDRLVKDTLAGVAPDDYYREVYQTEAYTRAVWTKQFEVLAYEIAGMHNYQDFWALRKS